MRLLPVGLAVVITLIQISHLADFVPFVGTYGDTAGYVDMAGVIFGWPVFAIYYQPLYPALLRVATLVGAEHFRWFVVLAQVALVVVTSLLIYAIVQRLTTSRIVAGAA